MPRIVFPDRAVKILPESVWRVHGLRMVEPENASRGRSRHVSIYQFMVEIQNLQRVRFDAVLEFSETKKVGTVNEESFLELVGQVIEGDQLVQRLGKSRNILHSEAQLVNIFKNRMLCGNVRRVGVGAGREILL